MSTWGLNEWGDIANIIIAVASVATAIVTTIVLCKQYKLQVNSYQPLFLINYTYEDKDNDSKAETVVIHIHNEGHTVKYISSPSIRTCFLVKQDSNRRTKGRLFEIGNYYRYGSFHKNLTGIIRDGYSKKNLSKYQEIYRNVKERGSLLYKFDLIKIEYIDINGFNKARYFKNSEPISKKEYNRYLAKIENQGDIFSISQVKVGDLVSNSNNL